MAYKYRPPLPDSYPWMADLPPKPGPSRHEIVDRIKTNLAYAHYRHGHGAALGRVNSMAACPECQRLSVELTYRRRSRPVEELFRR